MRFAPTLGGGFYDLYINASVIKDNTNTECKSISHNEFYFFPRFHRLLES